MSAADEAYDRLHGLDGCAQSPAQALRDAAQFFEREMSRDVEAGHRSESRPHLARRPETERVTTMSEHYRPLTAPETLDWLNGYAWFPGAVETEHGVMVPA